MNYFGKTKYLRIGGILGLIIISFVLFSFNTYAQCPGRNKCEGYNFCTFVPDDCGPDQCSSGIDCTEPAPFTLNAPSCSGSNVNLSWQNTVREDDYQVFRNSSLRTTLGADSTSYTDSAVYDTSFTYFIRARNFWGTRDSNSQTITCVSPDTTSPTVSVTSPTAGQIINGTINLVANATDNRAMSSVQFFRDGSISLGTVSGSGPTYTLSWDPSTTSDGSHTITAKATDTAGNSKTSSPVSITVSKPADSCTVPFNTTIKISWTSANATTCTVYDETGATKWTGTSATNQSDGPLTKNKTYKIKCTGGGGTTDPADTVNVTVTGSAPTASNITVTQPNYCVSGPAATVNWTYSDPQNTPQFAYQVQIDDQGSFNSPEVDSGKITCESCRSYSTPTGILQFNKTYKARVRVWNQLDLVSDWTISDSWKTPQFAFPQVNFTFASVNPGQQQIIPNSPVQFTDQTQFFDSNPLGHRWNWNFDDGSSSTLQNPQHTFIDERIYNVTLTATDNQNQSCSITKPVNVKLPNPIWKEVNPGG